MDAKYRIEPPNRFFEVAASLIRHEVEPRNKVTFVSQVDLTSVESIRRRHAALGLAKPSYTAFVVKALSVALRDHPYANRRVLRVWGRARLQRFVDVDISVAVERRVPGAEMAAFIDVLRRVDDMAFAEIGDRLRALTDADAATNAQWRAFSRLVGRLPPALASWLVRLPTRRPAMWVTYRGGAAMVSAPGKYGVDTILGNWWSPIGVSFGMVAQRPVAVDGAVVARPTFDLTLNFDVRVMAGAQAARFCRRLLDVLVAAESELAPWLPEALRPAAAVEPSSPEPKPKPRTPPTLESPAQPVSRRPVPDTVERPVTSSTQR